MYKLTLTAGLCLIIASLASAYHPRLVCYYDSSSENRPGYGKFTIADIDPTKCTHVIFGFADIDSQHKLVPTSSSDISKYASFNALKTGNANLKTLLGVGGPNFNTAKFSAMVSPRRRRQRFIQSAITLLRANRFDGLNLDWWYPAFTGGSTINRKFTKLCKELNEAFVAEGIATNQNRLLVTSSVSAIKAIIDASYEVSQIATYLDFINVLTIKFHDPWESVTGHHSPLYQGSHESGDKVYSNIDYAMQYWQSKGAPTQKLNMGFGAFAQAYYLSSSANNYVGAPVSGPGGGGYYTNIAGFWSYYEACIYLNGYTTSQITDQKVPYATKYHYWVAYEDGNSLHAKVNYLLNNNYGGAVVWSLDLDDFTGYFCYLGKCPFLHHLYTLLYPVTNPCTGKDSGRFVNPNDPHSFYNCAPGGIFYIQQCPANLVFNRNCDCCLDDGGVATTTPRPPDGSVCDGRSDGYFVNPADPTTYFQCDHGIAHVRPCPEGLVFKESCTCCNYP